MTILDYRKTSITRTFKPKECKKQWFPSKKPICNDSVRTGKELRWKMLGEKNRLFVFADDPPRFRKEIKNAFEELGEDMVLPIAILNNEKRLEKNEFERVLTILALLGRRIDRLEGSIDVAKDENLPAILGELAEYKTLLGLVSSRHAFERNYALGILSGILGAGKNVDKYSKGSKVLVEIIDSKFGKDAW